MIQNMILKGGSGSANVYIEQPTSVTKESFGDTVTLKGINHRPFCVLLRYSRTATSSDNAYYYNYMIYCEDENGNEAMNKCSSTWRNGSPSATPYGSMGTAGNMSYNASTKTLTLDGNWVYRANPYRTSDWCCCYTD